MSLISHIRRDAVTWTALGLVVAAILIVTTHHGTTLHPADAAPSHRDATTTSLGSKRTSTVSVQSHSTGLHDTGLHGGKSRARTPRSAKSHHSTLTATTSTTSTTVTTNDLTANTTTTTIVSPQPTSITSSGLLSYPGDVSSTYPFRVVKGSVRATLTWQSGPALALALDCQGAALRQGSSLGLVELTAQANTGVCHVSVSRQGPHDNTIRYEMSIHFLNFATPSP
jgi:hypothetical protein